MTARERRSGLSSRQLQCLALVAQGYTDPAIATELGIAETTVRYHIDRARRKLGATTRSHAVALVVAQGLIEARKQP